MEYSIERFDPITLFVANGSNRIYDPLLDLKNQFPDLRIVNQVYDHQVGWINRYDLDLLMAIDVHIAANPNIEQAYIDQGVRPKDVYYVEHGIDPNEVDPDNYPQDLIKGLKGKIGLPIEKKIITFAARMHPQKRPMDFVELARRFSSNSSVCFLMVGDGPLADQVDEQISKLGLDNMYRLDFYRPISDIYALTDVLVLPSEYEAMPLVVAEAQAMGKPVVVTDVGNNREVVELTGGGVVVPRVGDVAGLMEGVRKVLVSPPDPAQIRKAILSRFGIQAISKLYDDVFLGSRNG
jgi:glycosyltransferase involved in cell wall biosynthesis